MFSLVWKRGNTWAPGHGEREKSFQEGVVLQVEVSAHSSLNSTETAYEEKSIAAQTERCFQSQVSSLVPDPALPLLPPMPFQMIPYRLDLFPDPPRSVHRYSGKDIETSIDWGYLKGKCLILESKEIVWWSGIFCCFRWTYLKNRT